MLLFSIFNFFKKSKEHPIFWGAGLSLIIFSAHSLVETAIFSPVVLTLFLIIISFNNYQVDEEYKFSQNFRQRTNPR
jgi:fumarate reductase subunit D